MERCATFTSIKTRFGINCIPEFICKFLDHILGFTAINRLYSESISYTDENKKITFFDAVLKKLDVQIEVLPKDLARMPKNGPLLVVANHPFGGIDGLALGSLLSKIRPDFKLLVNQELGVFKAMKSRVFEVNILSGDSGKSKNLKAMINSSRFLKNGNCLGVFPAGEVSSLNILSRKIIDTCWSHHPAALARRNNASVLPICFIGNNGWLFQIMGLLHPKLRTLLLAKELINKKGQNLKMRIGEPISPQKIRSFNDSSDATEY